MSSTAGNGSSAAGGSAPSNESRWARWGKIGFDKSIKVSDWASGYANAAGAKVGAQRFWPKSGDFPEEVEKCEKILRAFTVEGVPAKEEKVEEVTDGKGNRIKKHRRLLKKIPPAAIKRAKGIAIYSSMRTGIAPFGGAGGTGLVMARLPDGSWSAPSSMSPNNLSAGLLLGVEFFDVILLINSSVALESFKTHKFTLGAETVIAAGPLGIGGAVDVGVERAPVYSYFRTSAGLYGGLELIGQVFAERFDENERVYHWPGVKGRDILEGRVRTPPIVAPLHRALRDAEMGVAQGGKLESTVYDIVKVPDGEHLKALGPNAKKGKRKLPPALVPAQEGSVAGSKASSDSTAPSSAAASVNGEGSVMGDRRESTVSSLGEGGEAKVLRLVHADQDTEVSSVREKGEDEEEEEEILQEGERLRLPPTPAELEAMEAAGIPDDEDLRMEQVDREAVYRLPAPPMHPNVVQYWRIRPALGSKRPTTQLKLLTAPEEKEFRRAQYTALPPSPVQKDTPIIVSAAEKGKEGEKQSFAIDTSLDPADEDKDAKTPVTLDEGERREGEAPKETLAQAEAVTQAEVEAKKEDAGACVVGLGLEPGEAEEIMEEARKGGEVESAREESSDSRAATAQSLAEELQASEDGHDVVEARSSEDPEPSSSSPAGKVDERTSAVSEKEDIAPSPTSETTELRTAPPSPLSSEAHLSAQTHAQRQEDEGVIDIKNGAEKGEEEERDPKQVVETLPPVSVDGAAEEGEAGASVGASTQDAAAADRLEVPEEEEEDDGAKTPVGEKTSPILANPSTEEEQGGATTATATEMTPSRSTESNVSAEESESGAATPTNGAKDANETTTTTSGPTPNRPPRSRARGKRGGKA